MNFVKSLALAAILVAPTFADSIPSLGCASSFGVLAGAIFNTSGTLNVTGDDGTTAATKYTNSGTVIASGTNFLDAAPACASTDFVSALTTAEGFTPTVTAPVGGAPPSATFTLGSGNTVFSLTNSGFTAGSTFTFNDAADPGGQFIIEMSALTISGIPTFSLGAVSPANILWVVTGDVGISGAGTWDGSIFSGGNIGISGAVTYNGGLYAENNFVHSGSNTVIDELGGQAVPEPSSLGFLAGAIALGFAALKFRRQSVA
ncbi:MAG: ice-binding family protein [Acidobacteriia bacterium]|nr:ice-binding family protein [Terriglobia bacterium]